MTPLTAYQKQLIVFLSVATFFEGYDYMALAQILPQIRDAFGLGTLGGGALVAFANLGTVAAYLIVRSADTFGRRAVLQVTILGYALFSLLTALSPNAYALGACQFMARGFLIGEWGVAMVIAAEEFPADRRGFVIGAVQAFSSLGAVACVGLVPIMTKSAYGWRVVFAASAVPLLVMAVARRNLRETGRFVAAGPRERTPMLDILRGPYRRRIFELAAIWGLTYLCTQAGITFFKDFSVHDLHQSEETVAFELTVAAVVAMPLLFLVGKLLDGLGRRTGAVLIYAATVAGVVGAYLFRNEWLVIGSLIVGMFGSSAVLPVLNAYTTERFPTALRADAFAWSNNILGRVAYVLSPLLVGLAADRTGYGPAVAITAVGPLVALGLILAWLPETRGQELEQTSALH